jgi:Flp pilus assembly protein TadG
MMEFMSRRVRRFTKDERGVSAIEFAMVLPLLVTLYLGGVEVSQAVAIQRKVTLTARTVADLVTRVQSVSNTGITGILQASTAVLAPYPADKAAVTVALIKIDANKTVSMEWSRTQPAGGTVEMPTVPGPLIVANTYLVWGETSYAYKPTIGYTITGTLNLKDQIFMRPRLSEKVDIVP